MNVAVSAGANAATIASLARSKVIEHFEKAGALEPETAVLLPAKSPRYTVEALIKHKVLIPAGEGLFYVDLDANKRWLREQGNVAVGVIVVMLLLLGIVIIGVAATR
ncbi:MULTISPECIES: hypothetical protein [unclassified Brevundimonas]|uniref:hypothetical protein n=1 Tax=unclassified Brevundimonas TaxID=2622653 RepID=UPI0025BA4630|nr:MULTISPECIES: hypothetical protein [unclassified Brevundimonas]